MTPSRIPALASALLLALVPSICCAEPEGLLLPDFSEVIVDLPLEETENVEALRDDKFEKLKLTAGAGDLRAMFQLGLYHLGNEPLSEGVTEAVECFGKARDGGYATAGAAMRLYAPGESDFPRRDELSPGLSGSQDAADMFELALPFLLGRHVMMNHIHAAVILETASEMGLPEADLQLALMYRRGLGVSRDDRRARELAEKAAASGHPGAQRQLAIWLWEGVGGKPSRERAAKLLEQSESHALQNQDPPSP